MILTTFHVFTMLVLMLSLSPQETSAKRKPCVKFNGCSVPGGLPFFYKKTFTPACNKHDVCYSCGLYYTWPRCDCDNAFKRDMTELCNKKNFFIRKACRGFAKLYYKAVKKFGRHHYNDCKMPNWCKTSYAKKRGDPTKTLSGRKVLRKCQ